MARTKKKVEKEKVKVVYKEKIVEKEANGIIETELGYNVVHNGKVVKEFVGSNALRVAIKDYLILKGV